MRLFRLLALGLATSALFACAQEREPIDRTQPNYYDKEYFDGEWYYQRTIVDVPAGEGPFIVGEAGWRDLYKITWDVQENWLYARRSYELLRGGDQAEQQGEDYEGEVVAAYPITRHFDRTYAYNPTTGERLNIIEENSIDRPWFERQYIRVDWSQNMIHNGDTPFETTSVEPVPYFVQEYDSATGEKNPDAPVFEANYFDVTNKFFARAGVINYPPYGDIPLCWFYDHMECGAGEYTIRNSFKRIDPNHQYEIFPYKGKMTEVFGYFWADRDPYDPTGLYIQNRERYLHRFNLWKKSFDDEGNPLPYDQRELNPIVYHVNREWPADDVALNEGAIEAARQWNVIFEEAVTVLGYPLADDEDVFIFCVNNPVKEGDPEACGAPGTSPRIGDLRYNFVAWVPKYGPDTPLGFGPSNIDPESAEVVNASSYIYERNELAIERQVQMIEVLNGTRDPDAFISGIDLTEWLDAVSDNNNNNRKNRFFPLEEARHMVQKKTQGRAAQTYDGLRQRPTAEMERMQEEMGVEAFLEPYLQRMYEDGVNASHGDHGAARLARLAGTELEDMMLGKEVLMAAGQHPADDFVTEEKKGEASVLRGGGFSRFLKDRMDFLESYRMQNNMFWPEYSDAALIGIARKFKDEGLNHDQIRERIKYNAYVSVISHEVGHNLGLMHNFGASDDALNYSDEFWALRTADGTVGPRTIDPITDEELNGEIYRHAQTSTMDYSARFGIDLLGLGKYDRAAILFGYARKVEVFKDIHGLSNAQINEWYFSDGDPLFLYSSGPEAMHYSAYYDEMGEDLWNADNRELVDMETMTDDFAEELGRDGRARVPYIYCSHSRVNLGDSCLTWDYGTDAQERMEHTLDELDFWYIDRNFPRGRIGVDNWNYVRRTYRYYDRIKQWHDIYGLYVDLFPQWYEPAEIESFLMNDVNGWGGKTWAIQNAFNHLIQTVLMPDVNDYVTQRMPDGKQMLRPSVFGGGTIVTDVSNARYFSTSWTNDYRECGYFFWECMHHVGYYLDKIMAIEAMSDSETNFVGRSSPEDIREWEVSYYSTFADQIGRINQAILGQDWSKVAPYWEAGQLKWPNYAGEMLTDHAQPLDPYATFSIQLYWQALGRARFPSNFDRSFNEESRIWVSGTGLEPDLPADRFITYFDPISGMTYKAVTYSGTTGQPGAGESAILRANRIKARGNYCDDAAGTATLEDDCRTPEQGLTRARADAALVDWNEVLKAMSMMDYHMDWGDPYDP